MYKIVIVLLVLTACQAKDTHLDNVVHLKNLGYKKLFCDQISYQKSEDESINIWAKVKPIDPNISMLLARCLDDKCVYEEIPRNFIPATAICQRFVITGDGHTPLYDDKSTALIFNVERY